MTWASVCSTKPSGTSRAITCVTEGASLSLLHTPSFSWSLKHLLPPPFVFLYLSFHYLLSRLPRAFFLHATTVSLRVWVSLVMPHSEPLGCGDKECGVSK